MWNLRLYLQVVEYFFIVWLLLGNAKYIKFATSIPAYFSRIWEKMLLSLMEYSPFNYRLFSKAGRV